MTLSYMYISTDVLLKFRALTLFNLFCHHLQLAEVPGTARVNMQPAEHLCPSGFKVSGPPGPGVGGGSNLHQNLPWTGR